MLRLRRWRVARVRTDRKGGYDSPGTRYWTHRGARAAAIQLNMLHEKFGSQMGILSAFGGKDGFHRWMPIRDRTLRGVQTHNIVMESGSYDRHPAGSGPLSSRIKGRIQPEDLGGWTIGDPVNLCSLTGECAGPWNLDGHCVHCGELTVPSIKEETSEDSAGDQEVPADAAERSDDLGGLQGDPGKADVSRRPVPDEVGRTARRERDELDVDDVEHPRGT